MATRLTSGRSRPSLKRLIPTSTSYLPFLRSSRISVRSKVATSEWRYWTFNPCSTKYVVRSSAVLLVKVVTKVLCFLATVFLISSITSATWFLTGRISTSGSGIPVGLTRISTVFPPLILTSHSLGVAEDAIKLGTLRMNSSNLNGRLSRADGSLNP